MQRFESMDFRLIVLTALVLASVYGGEFIEPNPEFLRSFWKTLLVEEEMPPAPPHSSEQPGDASLPEQFVRPTYVAPHPSLLFGGAMALAAVTGLFAAAELLLQFHELFFRLRLKSALDSGDYPKILGLLQHHLCKPPGTSLNQLAASIADAKLADQIRALEVEKYAPSNQLRKL